ncbi:MAG: DUF4351 domain-containing protein [Magnetococcus sp. YQC-5]
MNKEIIGFEEKQKLRYVSSMERYLEERARNEIEAKMLMRLLQRRFGEVPAWASEKLDNAESPALEEWGVRLLDAQSLDEVFADLV